MRRKWQTLWDMFPNNKLYGHQPIIKLETREPLPNRRQDMIFTRIRIVPNTCLSTKRGNCTQGTQLTTFSQFPKILSPRFRCMTSLTSPGVNSIWDFYFDISEWHILSARAWTPALMLHLTNPCAEGKILSLTKPKGKIYKTKSLGNYITLVILSYIYFPVNIICPSGIVFFYSFESFSHQC